MNLSVFLDRSFSLVNLMCFQINIAINQSDLRGKLSSLGLKPGCFFPQILGKTYGDTDI